MSDILLVNSITMVICAATMVVSGALADRVSWVKLAATGVLVALMFSYLLFRLLNPASLLSLFLVQSGLGIAIGIYSGPLPAMIVKCIPAGVRYTTFALGFNLSGAILGGCAPLFALLLVQKTHNAASPGLYLTFWAFCALLALFFWSRKDKREKAVQVQG